MGEKVKPMRLTCSHRGRGAEGNCGRGVAEGTVTDRRGSRRGTVWTVWTVTVSPSGVAEGDCGGGSRRGL